MPRRKAPRQWDVWSVDLRKGKPNEQTGEHPAVVVSSDRIINQKGLAIVAPITSTDSADPWTVQIEASDAGIDHTSWIECHQLQAVSTSPKRFIKRFRRLVPSKRAEVALAIEQVLKGVFPQYDPSEE